MNIQRVFSYKTTDGQLHTDAVTAHTHETKLALSGLIQRTASSNPISHTASFAPHSKAVASFILENEEHISKLLRELREKKRRAKK